MSARQKITTFLWFDENAAEAAALYTSTFKTSKVIEVIPYGEAGPGPTGSAMIVSFQLDGQEFIGLNGGPQFKFTEAISLAVTCETQEEVDELWTKLCAGGEEGQCGWLKDRFGLSWQIVPAALPELMRDRDPEKTNRVMQAMMPMKKIDIVRLRQASTREGASS